MKDYKKFMRQTLKDEDFELVRTSRSSPTVKLRHKESGRIYSIHPGNNAVRPLKQWIKWIKREMRKEVK